MSFIVILFGFVFVFLFTIAYFYVKNAFSYWEKRDIPYISASFPFGNFAKMFLQQKSLAELVIELYNKSAAPVLGVYITVHPSLIVRDPKILRDIFIKEFASFYHRGTNTNEHIDPMSNNLLMQNGEKWKHNRSKLTPAFSSGKLRGMFTTIVNCGRSLHQHIERMADTDRIVEIRDIFARYATNVIASVAFGLDVDCIHNPNTEFRLYGQRYFQPTPTNMFRFHLAFIYPKLVELLRLRFTDADIGAFMTETVRQTVDYREKNQIVRKDFLQLLMQLRNIGKVHENDDDWSANQTAANKLMSLDEMAAHSFVFYTASFESSSTTMSFCMYELAKRSPMQHKVHAEIDAVLAKYDGQLTYESIGEMTFLEQCIDETLRLHPPFGTVARKCMKDYKIEHTNLIIEEGTSIIIPVAAIHRDPKYFSQPHEFRPERFSDESMANQSFIEMPYMPFGDG